MEKGSELVSVSLEALLPPCRVNTAQRSTTLIQHVRRKLASLLPASPEISIPLSAVLQTAIASVFLLTLRFSSALVAGAVVVSAVRPSSFSSEAVMLVTVTAWSDRSAVSYLRVRRHS